MNSSSRARRATAVAALFVIAAMAVTAGAALGAASWSMAGPVTPSGTVDLEVTAHTKHGQRVRRYAVSFTDIPLECDDGPATFDIPTNGITVSASPEGDGFGLGMSVLARHHKVLRAWRFDATVVPRESAEGIVRVHGTKVPIGEGERDRCDSGKLNWTAELVP